MPTNDDGAILITPLLLCALAAFTDSVKFITVIYDLTLSQFWREVHIPKKSDVTKNVAF